MAKRCGSVAGGRHCPRPARRVITLTVPGHELYPITLFRCDDCLWAWDTYDRQKLDDGVDVRVGEYEQANDSGAEGAGQAGLRR